MNNIHTKSNILSSLLWKFMERGGTQGVQFVIQIILARILAPDQFGTLAIVMVFINLAQVSVQSGFNIALIQKKDADEIDFSSVFYLSLFIAGLLYLIIFLTAPLISSVYSDPILIPALRVLSITLFFGAFNSIQNAFISRNLMFKKLFKSSLFAIIISGACGIFAAYHGLGVWALVIQQLTNQVVISIVMVFTVNWRPKLIFSFLKVKILFSYGWKLMTSYFINILYMDLRTLIIGHIYMPDMLGFYNRGQQIPKLAVTNIDGSIQSIMLPILSANQDNKKRVKDVMRRAIISSSFLIFPMMIGMAVIAEQLVKTVLTEKWLPSVPFLQMFCFSYALMPIQTANEQAINAMGRSDIFLKLEVIKKIIGLIILAISIPFGVYSIALGQVLCGIIGAFINAYPNKKLLNYNYKEQWLDIIPSLMISIIMGFLIYLLSFLRLIAWKILIIQVLFGVIIYCVLATTFKLESFNYLINTVKEIMQHRSIRTRRDYMQ